jgi:ATP synthase protein I
MEGGTMTQPRDGERLKTEVGKDIRVIEKAEREKRTLIAQTAYLGTLGVILVLPIVAGAYLGAWLDGRLKGYSFSWTVTFIILGVFLGATNVYFFIHERR